MAAIPNNPTHRYGDEKLPCTVVSIKFTITAELISLAVMLLTEDEEKVTKESVSDKMRKILLDFGYFWESYHENYLTQDEYEDDRQKAYDIGNDMYYLYYKESNQNQL